MIHNTVVSDWNAVVAMLNHPDLTVVSMSVDGNTVSVDYVDGVHTEADGLVDPDIFCPAY